MKRKTLCIIIALTVLSISAIIGAKERFHIYGRFSSTLNGVPVWGRITLFPSAESIKAMRTEDLVENWADHEGRFVRFTGVVESVETGFQTEKVRRLTLKGDTIDVYPPDSRHVPETYERGHKYEFTGFLIRYEEHAEFKKDRYPKIRVYAFGIWPR